MWSVRDGVAWGAVCAVWALSGAPVAADEAGGQRPAAASRQAPFATTLSLDEMRHKQAVVETTLGTFVIALLPEAAPNHVGYMMKLAGERAYDGTTFHSMIRHGIVQGGDPLSKAPDRRGAYGSGGLGMLRAERNAETHTRGAVSAVIVPGQPDSAGAQFFVCVTDQPALDGNYTVFGRVVEGMAVVEKLSETPVDAAGKATERVEIVSLTIRDTPPPEPTPFGDDTVAELAAYRAVLETSLGDVTVALRPDLAPGHVRNFLRLAQVGAYDGIAFHRVVPGFVVQTGSMAHRSAPLDERQQKYVGTLAPEFSDVKHERGVLSMARGDDPTSASTSFFICTAPAPSLDGQYTIFGHVVEGLDVVDALERVPVSGETPIERIELVRVRLERGGQ
jgi:peptidyl-prolyl cis-trans isomerase B (cyclophilin B)